VAASVLGVSSRALLDACTRFGLDTAEILAAAKLDAVTLQDPDARLPIAEITSIPRRAENRSAMRACRTSGARSSCRPKSRRAS
jgi:hypothetical protein